MIREDPTLNIAAGDELERKFPGVELIIFESGGDNLASTFSLDLVDWWIFVIDVAGGDDIPRKRGPGVLRCDLLVVNKIDLAPFVGVDLDAMLAEARAVREGRPILATNARTGDGVDAVARCHEPSRFVSLIRRSRAVLDTVTRADKLIEREQLTGAVEASLHFSHGGGRTVLARQRVPYPFHATRTFLSRPGAPGPCHALSAIGSRRALPRRSCRALDHCRPAQRRARDHAGGHYRASDSSFPDRTKHAP